MTADQGRGMQALKRLAGQLLERLSREEARSFIDALSAEDFAQALDAMSAAGVATTGDTGGNLFYESAAARIRAMETPFPRMSTHAELLAAQGMPEPMFGSPPCKAFSRKNVVVATSLPATSLGHGKYEIDLSKVKSRFVSLGYENGTVVLKESDRIELTDQERLKAETTRLKRTASQRRARR